MYAVTIETRRLRRHNKENGGRNVTSTYKRRPPTKSTNMETVSKKIVILFSLSF